VPSHADQHAVIVAFFTSLQRSDFVGLRRCYAPDVVYSDPIFGELRGERALAMWEMICAHGDLAVEFGDVHADDTSGSARWEARYAFSTTGRPVHNIITSRFCLAGGLITEQHESFDVHRWAGMALGPAGRLLGWAPPVRTALHRRSTKLIDNFVASRGSALN
jgi:hypothetical protein